jgi:uncharacterized protein (DUF58 family)
MKFRGFLFFLILVTAAVFTDFAGAKILLIASIVFLSFCGAYVRMHRLNLSLTRTTRGDNLLIGLQDENSLTLSNNSFIPLHCAEVSDSGDLEISQNSVNVFIASAHAREQYTSGYALTGRKRGKYRLGPSEVVISDPAGIFTRKTIFENSKDIIVYPPILPITGLKIKSFQPLGSIKFNLPIFEDHTLLSGTREYQPGDDTRKINWRLSARRDKPIVNTYQSTVSAEIMIALNLFSDDYRERRRAVQIEESITCAASLAAFFSQSGQKTGICINGYFEIEERIERIAPGNGSHSLRKILSELAIAQGSHSKTGLSLLEALTPLTWGSSIYYITPCLDEASAMRLMNLSGKGYQIYLINTSSETEDMHLINISGLTRYTARILDGVICLAKV